MFILGCCVTCGVLCLLIGGFVRLLFGLALLFWFGLFDLLVDWIASFPCLFSC